MEHCDLSNQSLIQSIHRQMCLRVLPTRTRGTFQLRRMQAYGHAWEFTLTAISIWACREQLNTSATGLVICIPAARNLGPREKRGAGGLLGFLDEE